MKWVKDMFSDANGFTSSKRGLGALCLIFGMMMTAIGYVTTRPHEIPANLMAIIITLIGAGTTLLGVSILEKKQ